MKKTLAVLSLAALALTATPAFAKDKGNNGDDHGLKLGKLLKIENHTIASDNFVLTGTVHSVSAPTLLVDVRASVHVPSIINNQAIVTTGSDTKITKQKDQAVLFADIHVGDQIVVQGTVAGSILNAKRIHIIVPKGSSKAFGEVTAKTDTSITLKNNLTGVSQTFTTNADTKVKIDGETKTTADIHVGDKGFVKFKNMVGSLLAKAFNLFR